MASGWSAWRTSTSRASGPDEFGLHWDGAVEYQSRRTARYRAALDQLRNHTYPCGCTRSEIADSALAVDGARVYGGTCRGGLAPGKAVRSIRVRATGEIRFTDRVQGDQSQDLERDVGDFVLWRADGQFAYQLAVVVDDAQQGVTDVVRGADLLDSTARQIYLQQRLGYSEPRYLHVPVVVNVAGEKLSKQTGAEPVTGAQRGEALRRAFAFLGQPATDDLAEGLRNWDASRIPSRRAQR